MQHGDSRHHQFVPEPVGQEYAVKAPVSFAFPLESSVLVGDLESVPAVAAPYEHVPAQPVLPVSAHSAPVPVAYFLADHAQMVVVLAVNYLVAFAQSVYAPVENESAKESAALCEPFAAPG